MRIPLDVLLENAGSRGLSAFIKALLADAWIPYGVSMEVVRINIDEPYLVLRGRCPHPECRCAAAFHTVGKAYMENATVGFRMISALRCLACNEFILAVVGPNARGVYEVEAYYPEYPENEIPEEAPEDVASVFKEALECSAAGTLRAALTMCGRALETSSILLGASGKNVVDKIEDLSNKGVIAGHMKDVAHTIRLERNRGAHAGVKTDDEVTREDIDLIIEFTRVFFQYVYVLPARLNQLRSGAADS